MLPRNMNLNIRSETARYNNEIFASDSGFSLGRYQTINASVPKKSGHRLPFILMHTLVPKAAHKRDLPSPKYTSAIMHDDEKIVLVLHLTGAFGICYAFCDNEGH